ncbi:MAG: hypothetical protein H6631_00675 [Anaerolineaceae bacterium]|nr:hypothetical protein [Anaerolineaceae bacterium]MCB9100307.1 hypothetical protein [Anaerolineales bacterium]
MPQVLTTNAQIFCPHGGKGVSIPTVPKWTVNGGIVLLEGDTGTLTCPFVLCPCVGYTLKSMGLNATTIDGRKVILATDFNQTFTGLPLLITETHQAFDDTTPAPLPENRPAPPPSPDMADMTKPVVLGIPPALAFNTMTMMPAVITATFTLTTAFPLKWVLTMLNGVAKINVDLTNGLPPGALVVPPGGNWSSPSLVVTVTLNAAFMAALGPGMHHFWMTGVSRRGLSGFAEVILTVT